MNTTLQSAPVAIGLTETSRHQTTDLLNTLLADYAVLAQKAKNYHWNVIGLHFASMHRFFGKLYETLGEDIDNIAERVRSLGFTPHGTMQSYLDAARLQEETHVGLAAEAMLENLLADTETLIEELRRDVDKAADLGDAGTADFLTGLMEAREKSAWMVRAMLSK